jgi:2-dehydro-3-deoxy-D-arabinonate dehydratase
MQPGENHLNDPLLYRTPGGPVVRLGDRFHSVDADWNDLVNDPHLRARLERSCLDTPHDPSLAASAGQPLAPIIDQEVWAAGVTYSRSRMARAEESEGAGGQDFYDRVYDAERPELFLKATAHRVVGPGDTMHLRRDSRWIVPEPELVLVVARCGTITGFTIGNDLSCRDIEGANPLYLPQAKTFDRCAAVGPGILVGRTPPPPDTTIRLVIRRRERTICDDSTTLSCMKRTPDELVSWLLRDNHFPSGCLLMTGTGIVPPADLSLQSGDVVEISIDGIGTLVNGMR